MTLTAPWKQKNYLGQFASESAALAFIQAHEWDSNGNGTGNPTTGMLFFDTAAGGLKVYNGSSWILVGSGGSGTSYWERTGTTLSPDNDGDIIQVGVGTVGNPGIASESYPTSGIYWDTGPEVNFSIGGTKTVEISSSGIGIQGGSDAIPSLYFINDPDTGFNQGGTNTIKIACSGTEVFTFNTTAMVGRETGGGRVRSTAGTETVPTYTFYGNTNTGIYRSAANTVAISASGTTVAAFDLNGLHLSNLGTTQGDITFVARASDPSIPIEGDLWFNTTDDVFRYYDGSTVRTLAYGTATNYWDRVGTILSPNNDGDTVQAGSGTAGAPSYAFETDTDSGFFSSGTNTIGVSASGSQIAQFSVAGIQLSNLSSADGDIKFTARASDPSAPTEGNLWFNTTDNVFRYYDGASTQTLATSGGTSYWERVSSVLSPDTDGDIIQVGDGAVGTPGIASETYTTSGFYWSSGPIINLGISGTKIGEVSSQGIATTSGSSTVPSFYFVGDSNTGFSRPSIDTITAVCGGTETFSFTSSSFAGVATGSVYTALASGSSSTPSYSFVGDTDTGMYRSGSNTIGFTTAGVERVFISSSGIRIYNTSSSQGDLQFVARTADPTSPVEGNLWFNTTDNVFRYYDGGSVQTLSTGSGSGTSYWERSGIILSPLYNGDIIQVGVGSAASPAIASETYTNTGLFWSVGPGIGFTFSGTQTFLVNSEYMGAYTSYGGTLRNGVGTAATPAISFMGDWDTGFYRESSNILSITTGGTRTARAWRSSSVPQFDLMRGDNHGSDVSIGNIGFYGYNNDVYGNVRAHCVTSGATQGGIVLQSRYSGTLADDFAVIGGVIVGDYDSISIPGRGNLAVENRVYVSTGSASTPSYSFRDDTDTGLYRYSTNALGITVAGKVCATFDPYETVLTNSADTVDLDLYRSNTPIISQTISRIVARGKDTAGNEQEYTSIVSVAPTVTSGSEKGRLDFYCAYNGTLNPYATLGYQGLRLANFGDYGDIAFSNRTGDPASASEGELWYYSTLERFRYKVSGKNNTIAVESAVSGTYDFLFSVGKVRQMTIENGIVTSVLLA